jgi:hypothetical protein
MAGAHHFVEQISLINVLACAILNQVTRRATASPQASLSVPKKHRSVTKMEMATSFAPQVQANCKVGVWSIFRRMGANLTAESLTENMDLTPWPWT